jgi:CHAD domain-containing protein
VDGSDALQPIAAQPPPLARTVTTPDALQVIARACAGQIKACQRGLRGRSAEALHHGRVGLRRWRTALSVFEDHLTDEGRHLKGELDWLAGELNAARDLDVLAPALAARAAAAEADAAALAALGESLDQARTKAYERAAAALRSERTRRLLWEGLRPTLVPSAGERGSGVRARPVVAKALARRRRQLSRLGPRLEALGAEDRHRLRIRAKKARYATELFGELFGHPRRQQRVARALKDLQDALGELNDIHVGKDLARALARETGDACAGFEAGLICGARAAGEGALLARADKAYRRFAAAGRFWVD